MQRLIGSLPRPGRGAERGRLGAHGEETRRRVHPARSADPRLSSLNTAGCKLGRYYRRVENPQSNAQIGVTDWIADYTAAADIFQPLFSCPGSDDQVIHEMGDHRGGGWSSGADRGRRTAACAASLASLAKRWAPAISPISLPAVNGPKPGSVSSWARAGRQARRALARGLRWCARACACGAVSSPSAGPSPQAGRHRRNPNSKRESESPGDPAKPGRSGEIGAGNPIALGSRGTSSSPCRPIRPRVGSWRSTSSTSIPWRTGMVQRPFVSADIVSS
jgi:hypothetical protein